MPGSRGCAQVIGRACHVADCACSLVLYFPVPAIVLLDVCAGRGPSFFSLSLSSRCFLGSRERDFARESWPVTNEVSKNTRERERESRDCPRSFPNRLAPDDERAAAEDARKNERTRRKKGRKQPAATIAQVTLARFTAGRSDIKSFLFSFSRPSRYAAAPTLSLLSPFAAFSFLFNLAVWAHR